MDIREIIRRLQHGQSERGVARDMDIDRKRVGQYRAWAAEHGLLEGPLPLSIVARQLTSALNPDAQTSPWWGLS